MTLSVLPFRLTICRLPANAQPPAWAMQGRFYAIVRTDESLSAVCEEALAPAGIPQEPGWEVLKVHGPLDFALTGVLSTLTSALAAAGVALFAVSTYDTDYLLVKADKMDHAVAALRAEGHAVE